VTAQPRSNGTPAAETPQPPTLADRWRKLALYAYSAIDLALDCTPREGNAMLVEAATELDGAIDELDALAMAGAA
jgi:hypothetical protein